ncbi:MAG: hypothetical protein Q7S32_00280 [bacterium]|nr:hypothetical protein [bacterium]
MKIFLVRHGYNDFDAGAASLGKNQIEQAAIFLKAALCPDEKTILLTSELTRAIKSADIISSILNLPTAQEMRWLTCDTKEDTFLRLQDFAAQNPEWQSIIAISHMPEIDETVWKFAEEFGQRFRIKLENASIHLVDLTQRTVQKIFTPS